MSEQTPAPSAPQTPAPEAAKPLRPIDYVANAKRELAARRETAASADPTAPTQPAPAPVAPSTPSSAAAAVLGGEPFAAPKAETPALDGSDPRTMTAMAQIIALEQESRKQLESLTQRERELASRGERLSVWEKAEQAKAAGDLVSALEALGIDYEALTAQVVLGKGASLQPATEELRKLQAEIEAVRAEATEREQKAAEQAAEARVTAYKAQVKSQLQADPKRWELLLSPIGNEGRDPVTLIEATMERHFLATGGVIGDDGTLVGGERLTPEQAADMLEAEIERRTREAATVGGEKLRRILALTGAATPASSAPSVTAPAATHSAPPPTTTTELATRGGPPDPNRVMTPSDYRQAARARARQELKR